MLMKSTVSLSFRFVVDFIVLPKKQNYLIFEGKADIQDFWRKIGVKNKQTKLQLEKLLTMSTNE